MRKNKKRNSNRLQFEKLEPRNLLAIIWDNPGVNENGFAQQFGNDADLAVEIVEHAIEDWDRYIENFDYQNVGTPGNAPNNNQYNIAISAVDFGQNSDTLGQNFGWELDQQGKPFFSQIEHPT